MGLAVIEKGRDLSGDVTLDCDAVVVGTGAGGSVALRELARAGLSAIALEEGPHLGVADFTQREDEMLAALYQERGGRTTRDMAIRVLMGRGVGGSTVHNTNLCKRTPDAILEAWTRAGVSGIAPREMLPRFVQIERELGVVEIAPELRNANNEALRRGADALGWRAGPLSHNRKGCVGSGFCELGCAYDAKQNALKVLLPEAIASGARVIADVDVRRVTVDGGRVTGVLAVARRPDGSHAANVRVRAKVVVLSAAAVGSAAIALRSGLPDPHGQAGLGLHLHPSAVVAGRFDEEVNAHHGIPQSYECTEHIDFEGGAGSRRRVWIVPAFAHPIGAAAMLPSFGASHMARMRDYRRYAVLTALVHDETRGRVVLDGERPVLEYALEEADRAELARGITACARLLFAAGAREILIPAVPAVSVKSLAELDRLDTSFVRPFGVPLSAVHPMSTLRLGDDPRTSSLSSQGEYHGVRGLFVCDGSIFPSSLGVPPQISIYAFALHLSEHVIARART